MIRNRTQTRRLIAALALLIFTVIPAAFAAAPTTPADPAPVDASTSVPVTTLLKWNTVFTTPTTPIAAPKVLFYATHTAWTALDDINGAVRAHFTNYTSQMSLAPDNETLLTDLADKQVLIIPLQISWSNSALASFGTSIGPALRQFVQMGGLLVVTDGKYTSGGMSKFLTNAGLMDVTFDSMGNPRTVNLTSTHPITEGVDSSFTVGYGTACYSSVGDAHVLAVDATTQKPVAAIRSIGAGKVLLLGWDYGFGQSSSASGLLLANAIRKLSFLNGINFTTYDVYFGTGNPPTTPLVTGTYSTQYSPGALAYLTNYYWKVVAHNSTGNATGPVWSFRTAPMPLPLPATYPDPPDKGTEIPLTTRLSCTPGAFTSSYSIRFDTVNPPIAQVATGLTQPDFTPSQLTADTTYYWQVISHNESGDVPNPVWSFTTKARPGAPLNPDPADGATSVPITTKLDWDSGTLETTATVQIAFFTAHADLTSEYPHTINAIRRYAPNFQATNVTTEDTPTLAAALAGKDVFVMVEQENWTASAMGAYGAKASPILRQFVQNGGLVIVCDGAPVTGSEQFLANAGLMTVTGSRALAGNQLCTLGLPHAVTAGIPQLFAAVSATGYSTVGDAQALFYQYGDPSSATMGAIKTIGIGNVLLLGWDYDLWSYDQARIIANAILKLPVTDPENYDVYFGTTNPPTTKILDHKQLFECDPGTLNYSTTYYWQVVAHNAAGDTAGPVWSFTTCPIPPPAAASNPSPFNQEVQIPLTTTFSWDGHGASTYDVRLDTVNPPAATIATGLTQPSLNSPTLTSSTIYYWQVISHNAGGTTAGPVWSFSTIAMPPAARNPRPADGATSVSINTLLEWNTLPGLASEFPLRVLVFTGHCSPAKYTNTVAAIRSTFTNMTITTTTTENVITLAQIITGFDVFIMPEQDNWTASAMADYATSNASHIRDYVKAGGLLVVLGNDPDGGPAEFLNHTGLMSVVQEGTANGQTLHLATAHPILESVSSSFTALADTTLYSDIGDAQALVTQASNNGPVAAIANYCTGYTLLLGWDYDHYNSDMARILGNAMRLYGHYGTSLDYTVLFGTTNPPVTPIQYTGATSCSPGKLEYSTTYYWRVNSRTFLGSTTGPVWSFRTMNMPVPAAPSNPTPANQATNVSTTKTLSWSAGSIPATFSIKFGTTNPPTTQIATGLTQPSFSPGQLNFNTTYYWQVTSTNNTGSTAGPVWSFNTPRLPSVPVYSWPTNGDMDHQLNATLWWEANDATSYDIYVGTTNPPTTKISWGGSGYCEIYNYYSLTYDTTYYWKIVARNQYGSTPGPVWSFKTQKPPKPNAPANPTPPNYELIVPTTATLSWSAATNAVSYSVKLDTKNPPVAQAATGLTATSFKPAALNVRTTYYWRVTATNASGSTDGPVWTFTTTPTPATPFNPAPASGATGIIVNPKLEWNTTGTKVLAFTGHLKTGSTSQYQKTLNAIRQHFTNFTLTETTTESATALEALLYDKDIFFIPNQDNSWTESAMGTFGTNVGPVLKKFVEAGGMIIVLDCDTSADTFWANTGLMTIDSYSPGTHSGLVNIWNALTEGLTPDGFYPIIIVPYKTIGDAQILLKSGYSYTNTGAAYKRVGAGCVLSSGISFTTPRDEMAQLLANAIKTHPSTTYDVYFGTTNPPTSKKISGTDLTHYSPPTLSYATTYYWRIIAHNAYGDTTGPVWSFRTKNLPLPAVPSQPNPINKQVFVPTTSKLSWTSELYIPTTFTVKFGTTNPPTNTIASNISTLTCSPGTLTAATTYYWQVTAKNSAGTVAGPVWSFSTPGLAHMPVNMGPSDKAKLVPLNTVLRWDTLSTVTLPVQILELRQGGSNTFYRTIDSMLPTFSNFVVTETSDSDPSKLSAQLAGKHVFLIPRTSFWSASQYGAFGTSMATVLKSFVQNGGLVVVCDYSSTSGAVNFLNNSGLMSVTANTKTTSANAKVVVSNIITQGVASTFTVLPDYVLYNSVGDATVLIKDTLSGNPFVAFKTIGRGGVLLMGWDYMDYNSKMGLVLANAVQYIGGAGAGVEHYDVYFGTSNPPTTKLVQGDTYKMFCSAPVLQYGKTYYWRVVVHNVYGDKTGPIWSFTATGRTAADPNWLFYQ